MSEGMQEKEIVRRCQDGDVDAFRMLYEKYGPLLLNTGLRMLGNRQDAEDAVQMTFVRLYKGIGNFRFDAKFSTYFIRILMNVCFDLLKRKSRLHTQTLDIVDMPHYPMHDVRIELEEAIADLPHQQRACFVLFAVEGMKQTEIAEIMGLSLGGVKSNIHHAKMRLRRFLDNV